MFGYALTVQQAIKIKETGERGNLSWVFSDKTVMYCRLPTEYKPSLRALLIA